MSITYDTYPVVLQVINAVSQGETVSAACARHNITVQTFQRTCDANSDLQELRREAEQIGHDAMAEALLQPDNHVLYGQTNPQMAKVMSDNIKWFLERKDPKNYGPKVEHNVSITMDKAIIQALEAARTRVPALTYQEAVDAEYVEVDDEDDWLT